MKINIRLKVFGLHFLISFLSLVCIAWMIFRIWFPYPFLSLAGGFHLFIIVAAVDVICGPLLTAVIYNPKKSNNELIFDLTVVAMLQISALGYGIYSVGLARPVILAFESDRFVSVSAVQINLNKLNESKILNKLSWTGPVLVGTRLPLDGDEFIKSVDLSIQGFPPSIRPDWWIPYEENRDLVKNRMKSINILQKISDSGINLKIDCIARNKKLNMADIFYLPLVSHKSLDDWAVILNKNADIIGYIPISGF